MSVAADIITANDERLRAGEAVIDLLSHAAAYPERTSAVERIDTHISWVFLTDRFVYKLKKPVAFDFLDFSTRELRREACEEEVRLNRRLAPDVYLGVVPIVEDRRGHLKLGGHGAPVDWVVKMKRLPADRALDKLILSRQLTEAEIDELARWLAEAYRQLPPLTIQSAEYRREIEQHVEANRHELLEAEHDLPTSLVSRVQAAQMRVLRLVPDLLDDRVCDGRIVDGHGDLRPEHIYLCPNPVLIDCIEFNAEFRQLDVLDELSFLAMECDAVNAEAVGTRIIERYQEAADDNPPDYLSQFYKCYRACVRAKVLSLRADQVAPAERAAVLTAAKKYLLLADRYASGLGPPLMLIVRGLPGTGKSTLASCLAESLHIEVLQTDAIRRDLFGRRHEAAEFNAGRYQPENRARVYDELFRLTAAMLDERISVILDGTFLSAELRSQAVSLAHEHGAKSLVIHCTCPDEVALQRIAGRLRNGNSLSETQPEFFQRQRETDEPDPPDILSCVADTSDGLPDAIQEIYACLRRVVFAD